MWGVVLDTGDIGGDRDVPDGEALMPMLQPDPGFTRKLRGIEDKLFARFNTDTERWQIWRKVERIKYMGKYEGARIYKILTAPVLVMTVQEEDGSYRPLDDRTIAHIRKIDAWRLNRYSRAGDELEELAEKAEADLDRQRDYELEEMAGEFGDDAARVKEDEWIG